MAVIAKRLDATDVAAVATYYQQVQETLAGSVKSPAGH
jgi:hypothetical protein